MTSQPAAPIGRSTVPEGAPIVLVTRPLPGGRELAEILEAKGFGVRLAPALEIAPPPDPEALREAAARAIAGHYTWIVFTSANGVRAFADALQELGIAEAAAPRGRIAAVGRVTAEALTKLGWGVDRVPPTFTAEGLLAVFEPELRGVSVLLPVAEAAREVLPRELERRGAQVDVVVAYRSTAPQGTNAQALAEDLAAGRVQLLTFTSPSTAANLLELVGEGALAVPALVIGPVTHEAARRLGYRVVGVAREQTMEGLVEAVSAWARGG